MDPAHPLLRAADDYAKDNKWCVGSTGKGVKLDTNKNNRSKNQKRNDREYVKYCNEDKLSQQMWKDGTEVMLNADGSIEGSSGWGLSPGIAGPWRQPYGWDDESIKRRAPIIWDLFDHINKEYLNDEFTIDGYPEEVGGSSPIIKADPNLDIDIDPEKLTPSIWTCYTTAKTGGIVMESATDDPAELRLANKKMNQVPGVHRDAPVYVGDESSADDFYSVLVVLNDYWEPSWGAHMLLHDEVEPEDAVQHHGKRGYGIGHMNTSIAFEPGKILVIPAITVHTGHNVFLPKGDHYSRRVMYRVRKKSTSKGKDE